MRGTWRIRQWLARRRERALLKDAEAAVAAYPAVKARRPHGLPVPLIVSLTSYPPRYPTLAKTLKSLLDQSVAADRTILWLGRGDEGALPDNVRALCADGLEIRLTTDIRSFKKLIPALHAFPEAYIVTADDDLYYRPDWLETILQPVDPANPAIVAARAHLAKFGDAGLLAPYASWDHETAARCDGSEREKIFPTGVGGVLYPPHSLDERVFDEKTFMRLCPHADDLWFFWMAMLSKTRRENIATHSRVITWDGTQEVGLYHLNVWGEKNDAQIRSLETYFGPLEHV